VREQAPVEGRPLEDTELARRAREGDDDAYEDLVKRYGPIAFRVAWLVTRDRDEAQDAAQEAFVKAYYALGRFRSGAPFRPWLLQIVANEARNRRKAAGRRFSLALRAAEQRYPGGLTRLPGGRAGDASGDAAPSPEVAALAAERKQALLDAVNRLREEERLVVACRYFLGLSEAETADTLKLPKGTVKSRLSRALDRLRVDLSATLGDDVAIDDGLEQAVNG
jgi:RNA polymerase sigma factor (sigma-70 family)